MMFEAMKLGLRAKRITRHLASTEQIAVKESLQWYWWPLEYFPFKRLTFTRKSDGRESTFWYDFSDPVVTRFSPLNHPIGTLGFIVDRAVKSTRARRFIIHCC